MGGVNQVIHKVLIVTIDDLDRGTHIGIAAISRAIGICAIIDKVDKSNHFPLRSGWVSAIKPSWRLGSTVIFFQRGFEQFASCVPNNSIPTRSFPISSSPIPFSSTICWHFLSLRVGKRVVTTAIPVLISPCSWCCFPCCWAQFLVVQAGPWMWLSAPSTQGVSQPTQHPTDPPSPTFSDWASLLVHFTQLVPKWHPNSTQLIPNWFPVVPKWYLVVPKWSPSGHHVVNKG